MAEYYLLRMFLHLAFRYYIAAPCARFSALLSDCSAARRCGIPHSETLRAHDSKVKEAHSIFPLMLWDSMRRRTPVGAAGLALRLGFRVRLADLHRRNERTLLNVHIQRRSEALSV